MKRLLISGVFLILSLSFAHKADMERGKGWVRGNPHPWFGLSMICMMLFMLLMITL